MPPRFLYEAGVGLGGSSSSRLAESGRDSPVLEELCGAVKNQARVQCQPGNPAGQIPVAINMDFPWTCGGKVMAESLKFERCSPADGDGVIEKDLEGDHNVLPGQAFILLAGCGQSGRRPAIYAARNMVKPSAFDVLAPEGSRIAVALQPGRIRNQSFGEIVLEPV